MLSYFVCGVILGALVVSFAWYQSRGVYERELKRLEGENTDLKDRMYLSRNQPPTETNMKARFEQQELKQEQRKTQLRKERIDPISALNARAIADEELRQREVIETYTNVDS